MKRDNENEWFAVKNGIKLVSIYVIMIGQVVLSSLYRNSHIFYENKKEIFGLDLDFFLKSQGK